MLPLDFNPFLSVFEGAADNNLFFAGNPPHIITTTKNHTKSSSSAHQCSGLRLQRNTKDAYIYVAAAPGMKSEDLEMTLERTGRRNDATVIHVRDGRNEIQEGTNSSSPRFHQHLSLGSNVDADRISACVVNGELIITAPKSSPQEPPQNMINVQMTRLTARA